LSKVHVTLVQEVMIQLVLRCEFRYHFFTNDLKKTNWTFWMSIHMLY